MSNGEKAATPLWLTLAQLHIGTKEIPGVQHHSKIIQWWRDIKRGGIKTDEVPWCAAFVGAMLEQAGIRSTRFESAKSYLDWGVKLTGPVYGCVVVFARDGGGHVGFVTAVTPDGRLAVLGGNQANMVSVAGFATDRVVGYRWPDGVPIPAGRLSVADARSSTSEA